MENDPTRIARRLLANGIFLLRDAFAGVQDELRRLPASYFFRRPLLPALVLYAAILLGARAAGWMGQPSAQDPVHHAGARCEVVGIVAEHPDARPTGVVYVVEAETIERLDDRSRSSADGRLLVQVWGSTMPTAAPGDRVRLFGRIQRPRGATVPGTFDYASYLADHGLHAVLYTSRRSFENLGAAREKRAARLGWRLKRALVGVFEKRLPSREATVLSGLVAGVRPRFHPELRRWFTESGTMHVLVASGSNVAYVMGLWFLIATLLLRLPRAWAIGTSLPLVAAYVLLVGADAPILRAGWMAVLTGASYLLRREDRPIHAVAAAALLILVVQPMSLFDAGFQMSFVTVVGMVLLLPDLPLDELDPRGSHRPNSFVRWLGRLLLVTVTAQVWLFPLSAGLFHQFSPAGLVANLVAIPLAAGGLTAGFLLVAIDSLSPAGAWAETLANGTASIVAAYLSAFIGVVRWFGTLMPAIWLKPLTIVQTVGFYLGCLCLIGLRRSTLCRLGFLAGALALLAGYRSVPDAPSLTWLNAGGGALAILEDGCGGALLLNPGRIGDPDDAERRVRPYLAVRGVRRVSLVAGKEASEAAAIQSELRAKPIFLKAGVPHSFGSTTVTTVVDAERPDEPAFVVRFASGVALVAPFFSLELQRRMLRIDRLDVLATRFTPRLLWAPAFVRRFRPAPVEISRSGTVETKTPWGPEPRRIARMGWWRWDVGDAGRLASPKDLNAGKTGRKAAGMGPPRHAAHLAADRGGR